MKKTKEQKGITLIALIITIIILLILAVVTINSIKNDGIIQYAQNARDDYKEKQKEEESIIDHYMYVIEESQSDSSLKHEGVIPEGGQYTAADRTVYKAGDKFPETVTNGDYYEYGDYKYTLTYTGYSEMFESVEEARKAMKEDTEART